MSLVQHSAATVEHYTPREFIEAAREVMGVISLDPASTMSVNHELVHADMFFSKETDGLQMPWWGSVWLNPPGGTVRTGKKVQSNSVVWWQKLLDEYHAGHTKQAVFLGFSIEILSTSQSATQSLLDFPICIPRKRIDFLRETEAGVFTPGKQPSHANVIAYLPPKDDPWAVEKFAQVFSKFGVVR